MVSSSLSLFLLLSLRLTKPSAGFGISNHNFQIKAMDKGRISQELVSPSRSSSVRLLATPPPFPDVERPDPSTLVAAQSDSLQRAVAVAIGTGLLFTTSSIVSLLSWLGNDILPFGFLETVLDFTVPIPLGLIYILLGATHFLYRDGYAAIVPPNGSWGGLWNIPAPGADSLKLSNEEYHVLWTGVAEIGGGTLFVLGGLNALPVQIPAFLLFLLTLAITPANVYMFTHDAEMSFAPPTEYPLGHLSRGIIQCVLLAILWTVAFQ
jgi:uncharacterized membrane protein